MKIPETASVDRIFEQVEDLAGEGLVLTADASLADALTARLDQTVLGEFASTPRRLVSEPEMEVRQETFLKLVNKEGMAWRQASYLLDRVVECWQHTGELEKIKEYRGFDTEEVDKVIETLEEASTSFGAMQETTIEKETAVVGLHDFNALDRKLLPEEYREVDFFTGRKYEIPSFKIFESADEIVRSLTENVKNVGADNAAVVVSPESQYQSMIEASFDAENIPYLSDRSIAEESDLRNLISILRIGLSTKNVQVKDVRPVLDEMDVHVSRSKDNRLLSSTSGLEEVQEFLNVLEYLDFQEVVNRLREVGAGDMDEVEELLDEIDLLGENVSEKSLSDLEFFIESFDPSSSSSSDGVLFVDPTSAAFVDRPVVFFIGMSAEHWTRETGDMPWRDEKVEAAANRKNFCALLQSGDRQVYMVQDRESDRDITPCYHLNEVLERDVHSFTDLEHEYVRPEDPDTGKGFKHRPLEVDKRDIEALSQSALNDLVLSPRLYYFRRLTSDIEDDKIEKGNIFHDYAEFHANHPSYVEQLDRTEILQHMIEHMKPFLNEYSLEQLKTELRIGLRNISSFLESREIQKAEIPEYSHAGDDNSFAEAFRKEIDKDLTEMGFFDSDLGVKGKIDLVLNETHLVDYKSGRKKSARDIVKASNVELYEDADWPDFQVLMYLTFHRKQVPGKRLKFTFLNFLDNLSEAVDGEASNEDNSVTIEYIPETFNEFISSLEMYEHLLREKGKTSYAVKVLNKLGCEQFREFFDSRNMSEQFDRDKALDSQLAKDFQVFCEQEIGEYKYVRKGTDQIIKEFVKFRCSNFFKEDLDAFEEFVQEKIDDLNEFIEDGFPLDAKPDDLPDRDMILDE